MVIIKCVSFPSISRIKIEQLMIAILLTLLGAQIDIIQSEGVIKILFLFVLVIDITESSSGKLIDYQHAVQT